MNHHHCGCGGSDSFCFGSNGCDPVAYIPGLRDLPAPRAAPDRAAPWAPEAPQAPPDPQAP